MANLDTLFVAKINNINIIQEGESVLLSENQEAEYSNPFGNNTPLSLGSGQEVLDIKFRSISDENTTALKKALRDKRDVTLLDKFKGSYKATVSSYRIIDSDKHIGVTKFEAIFKIKEDVKTAPQNIASKLKSNAISLSSAIDMSMNLDTVNLLDSAVNEVKDSVSAFESASNFADGTLSAIGEYRKELADIANQAAAYVNQPTIFKNKILGVVSGFKNIYATAVSTFEAAVNIDILFRDVTDSLSIFTQNEVINANVVANASNIVRSSILLDSLPDIEFNSMDEAKEAQSEIVASLDEVSDNDELVETIKNDLSTYIQSLNLPNVVEIEVFQMPLFILSYELYGNTDRVEDLRALNDVFEDDNVSGTVQVFDR
ncbi:MAG: hypothetical protein OQL19_11760 [Gammaproteobacteria bacterium]|nr:hypothetical protein [Gammaproteobacteria bacterium]